MVPAERFRTVQVYFSLCYRTIQNGSRGIELFRTIPDYLELNSNYFFWGCFTSERFRTVQNGSERNFFHRPVLEHQLQHGFLHRDMFRTLRTT